MPKLGFHSLSIWVSNVAGRPSGWPRRVSSSFVRAAYAASPHCVQTLDAWLGPVDVQGLRCGRHYRNWPNRSNRGLPTTDLGLSGVDFTNRAVGTDPKSRSRHYPRLPWESVSIYPHEMSLKPVFRILLSMVSAKHLARSPDLAALFRVFGLMCKQSIPGLMFA